MKDFFLTFLKDFFLMRNFTATENSLEILIK